MTNITKGNVLSRTSAALWVALFSAISAALASLYLTIDHYSHSAVLACPENATINCQKVTTSAWSQLAGVPVAVLGLSYFLVMTALLTYLAASTGTASASSIVGWRLSLASVALAGAGVLTALYLVYVELFKVDAICLWCTAVHVLTLSMFGSLLWLVTENGNGEIDV